MIIWQLKAKGPRKHMDGSGTIFSRLLFVDRSKAEEYVPAFTASCCNSEGISSIADLDEKGIEVTIYDMELVE